MTPSGRSQTRKARHCVRGPPDVECLGQANPRGQEGEGSPEGGGEGSDFSRGLCFLLG